MNETTNTEKFHEISDRLKKVDIDFFSEELHQNNHIYIFEAVLGFTKNAPLSTVNCEISMFPFFETINYERLTSEQRLRGQRLSRDPEKEPPKLLSYLKDGLKTVEYSENLLYLCGFHDVVIKEVKTIIRSQAFPFFRTWLLHLQDEKNKDHSFLIGKLLKTMGNSLAGTQQLTLNT